MSELATFRTGRWTGQRPCRTHSQRYEYWIDLCFESGLVTGKAHDGHRVDGTYEVAAGTCQFKVFCANHRWQWNGTLDAISMWGSWSDQSGQRTDGPSCSGIFRLWPPKGETREKEAKQVDAVAEECVEEEVERADPGASAR